MSRNPRLPLLGMAAVLATTLAVPSEAAAPPPGDISPNVTFVANVPEMKTAIGVNFIGDTMFVSAETGIYSYSVANPAAPKLLGALPMYIWENEDVDVDRARKLLFVSRDPRGVKGGDGKLGPVGVVHVIDVSVPHAMHQISQIAVGAGHTATCVNDCKWLWVGGPYANAQTQPGWKGRPIIGVDLRDPMNPKECAKPIDLGRNDGVTDYAHDVQVDPLGIAWVSGGGGVRGYRTSGRHVNPATGRAEAADGCNPIPYAGGGTPESATPSRFMHNSWRNPKLAIGKRRGDVLVATEEAFGGCETTGVVATYDLAGTYKGEGFKNIAKTQQRMKVLDTWSPADQEGSDGCASAHYFADRGDGILAYSFYGQGTRFLDVRNPRDIRQVGYYRPNDSSAFAAYWYKGHVFVADNARGIDVLRFGAPSKQAIAAPARRVPAPIRFSPSPVWGWACPVRSA